ncbi:MAG: hypothetical protein Q9192_000248 [Flavoplaca navasiana]
MPNNRPTYSDAAKGLLGLPHRNEQPSIGRNDHPREERAATSNEQHKLTDVPRTPDKTEKSNFPPQGSSSEYDPYPAARYHFTRVHYGLHSPTHTIPTGRPFPHDRVPAAATNAYNTPYAQRTPNPLQMTADQRRGMHIPQDSGSYGNNLEESSPDAIDGIEEENRRRKARETAMTHDRGPDLVKKYDVLLNQYTRRFYGSDLDQARYLPNEEVLKDEFAAVGSKS